MSDANRLRLSHVREVTLGTTPVTPRMRKARLKGETLRFVPVFVSSEEIRDDRMNSDPIKVNEMNDGPINGELSWPPHGSPFSDWLESLFANTWVNTPFRDNDGTADSVITAMTGTTDVVTCTTGAAFVAGQIAQFSGFATGANNGVFKCTTGHATSPVFLGAGFVTEAAPAAAARIKVVGFQGASADLVAVADGITSTLLDFTTLGLAVGQWIKIGGTATGDRFATAACNGWARVIAIAAAKLTLDNLPTGWTTDAGTGKTVKVFYGDTLKNGLLTLSQTIERGFMDQTVPTYIAQRGMTVDQGVFNFVKEQIATWTMTFAGLTGTQDTTSLDASPDAATTNAIMAAAVNVGRIAENGTIVGGPNFIESITLTIKNNLRMIGGIRSDGLVGAEDIGKGSVDVTAAMGTFFGSNALMSKLFAGTATNINLRIAKNSQAMIWAVPRLTYTDGQTNATAKNTDTKLPLTGMASLDTLTNAHVLLDRLEYYE
ncbi:MULTISPECIES: phage tail tube protein [Mesorhizobium]|uniref:phage tail tube protein n=1 Tax=Mesorhizobium TaxID=68287 RepID=UPI0010A951CE|nr:MULTISPECIES: phage tail tube protein [Mesorhizobium]